EVLDAVLAEVVVERGAVDAERAGRAGDVPVAALDGGDDLVLLLLLEPGLERPRPSAARRRRRDLGRGARSGGEALRGAPAEVEIRGEDLGAAGDDDRALDDVLELAHVARPVVGGERADRRGLEAAHRLAGRAI